MDAPAVPREVKECVAGFFDGDGSVGIYPTTSNKTPVPTVKFCQSRSGGVPPELEFVQRYYGGIIRLKTLDSKARRAAWTLTFSSMSSAMALLEDLEKFTVVKTEQVSRIINYLRSGKSDPIGDGSDLKKLKQEYAKVAIDAERITVPYIAGFFMADGCVSVGTEKMPSGTVRPKLQARIRKRSCPQLLAAIRGVIGYGVTTDLGTLFVASGLQGERLLGSMLPHLAGSKRQQAELALAIEKGPGTPFPPTTEQQERNAERAKQIKKLKRQ